MRHPLPALFDNPAIPLLAAPSSPLPAPRRRRRHQRTLTPRIRFEAMIDEQRELVLANLGLIGGGMLTLSGKYIVPNGFLTQSQAKEACEIGLYKAAKKWRVERCIKFSTYAYAAMLNELIRENQTAARKVLYQFPTGFDQEDRRESRRLTALEVHLDVETVLKKLSARQRQALCLWFGIGRKRPMKPAEIAERMGLTVPGLRKLVRQALAECAALLRPNGDGEE